MGRVWEEGLCWIIVGGMPNQGRMDEDIILLNRLASDPQTDHSLP